jgi:predicted transcriptional regulator
MEPRRPKPHAKGAESAMPIGPLQLRIMHAIWRQGPGTVHDVRERLHAEPGAPSLAYTTYLTVMRNLVRRGLLGQVRGTGKAHTFSPLVDEHAYKQSVLKRMFEDYCANDARLMLRYIGVDAADLARADDAQVPPRKADLLVHSR